MNHDDDETVEAPVLSMHEETGTECSPSAPCGVCQQRAEGVPIAGLELTCGCRGLGIHFDGVIFDACEDHPLPGTDSIGAAAERLTQILAAVADVRDIIAGKEGGSALDRYLLIRDKLAFIKPNWR